MGFVLLPLIVLTFFISIIAIERNHSQDLLPPSIVSKATASGQLFVAYRNAVAVYQHNNPTFTGTVTNAALAAQGNQFPSDFLASASNVITATGVTGRVITCFAALPVGALSAARTTTENDASLGVAVGTSWTGGADGATVTPLATSVPTGNIVSVIQIGA